MLSVLFLAAGYVVLVGGVALVSVPAAAILAGVLLIVTGAMLIDRPAA